VLSLRRCAVLALALGLGLALVVALAPATHKGRGAIAHKPSRARVVDLGHLVDEFVDAIPRRGSEAMEVPTSAEAGAFTDAVAAANAGRLEHARALLDPLSYQLLEIHDATPFQPATLLVLRERQLPDGTWPHGWGLYVFRADPAAALVVQVPHPLFDVHTAEAGVTAFRHGHAQSLFVAGTHRYANADHSSDVAHDDESMFQHVTRAVVGPNSTVLQFHGFGEGSFPHYGEVVVSDGSPRPSAPTATVAEALRDSGFATCLYDGTGCAGLAATTNVQGRWARAIGADFLHLEVIRHLRDNTSHRNQLARLVVKALRQ
jgi:hypothetical protein